MILKKQIYIHSKSIKRSFLHWNRSLRMLFRLHSYSYARIDRQKQNPDHIFSFCMLLLLPFLFLSPNRSANTITLYYTFRYCSKHNCQLQKPAQQVCTCCGMTKDKNNDFKHYSRHYSLICKTCELPNCMNCGKSYPPEKRAFNPTVTKLWFCSETACQLEAKRRRRRAAK